MVSILLYECVSHFQLQPLLHHQQHRGSDPAQEAPHLHQLSLKPPTSPKLQVAYTSCSCRFSQAKTRSSITSALFSHNNIVSYISTSLKHVSNFNPFVTTYSPPLSLSLSSLLRFARPHFFTCSFRCLACGRKRACGWCGTVEWFSAVLAEDQEVHEVETLRWRSFEMPCGSVHSTRQFEWQILPADKKRTEEK